MAAINRELIAHATATSSPPAITHYCCSTARRVVTKVEFHTGELFPRVGFIVTNLETPSRIAVRFYDKRGRQSSGSTR